MKNNMNCINELLIQRYIDQELGDLERIRIEQHLLECVDCRVAIQKQKEWTIEVKSALGKANVGSNEIPDFRMETDTFPRKKTDRLIYSLMKIAALIVFILGGAYLLTREQTPVYQPTAEDMQLWMEANSGNDANYDWHNRQITMPLIDLAISAESQIVN